MKLVGAGADSDFLNSFEKAPNMCSGCLSKGRARDLFDGNVFFCSGSGEALPGDVDLFDLPSTYRAPKGGGIDAVGVIAATMER